MFWRKISDRKEQPTPDLSEVVAGATSGNKQPARSDGLLFSMGDPDGDWSKPGVRIFTTGVEM